MNFKVRKGECPVSRDISSQKEKLQKQPFYPSISDLFYYAKHTDAYFSSWFLEEVGKQMGSWSVSDKDSTSPSCG